VKPKPPAPVPAARPSPTTRFPSAPALAPVAVLPDTFAMPGEAPASAAQAAASDEPVAAEPVTADAAAVAAAPTGPGEPTPPTVVAEPVPSPPPPAETAAPGAPAGVEALAATDDPVRLPLPSLPEPRSQRFRVFWGDYTEQRSVARLVYRFEHDGERYEIRTTGEAEGLISLVYRGALTQVSAGRLGPGGLEPLRYTEQRGTRPERTVVFDPDARRLVPGGGSPVPMPPGTQDRLSVFYQIGLLARAAPERFTAGRHYDLPVASMREVRRERFDIVGDAILMVPGGPIRALHLHRPALAGSTEPKIDLWLGYDFQMLPVRLRVEDAQRRVLDHLIERDG
jgi:hypothetical protein